MPELVEDPKAAFLAFLAEVISPRIPIALWLRGFKR
jgi:hypothetical protein